MELDINKEQKDALENSPSTGLQVVWKKKKKDS